MLQLTGRYAALVCLLLAVPCGLLSAQTPSGDQPAPANVVPARDSIDAIAQGCGNSTRTLTKNEAVALLKSSATDEVIKSYISGKSRRAFTANDMVDLVNAKPGRSDDLLKLLGSEPDVYIGWSVLPPRVVRDNYGHYVVDKYFGLDVAIANRSVDATQSIIVTALEFCHPEDHVKDISADPTLVRGSLQKGELTGKRANISNSIQAIGTLMAPAAPFFKNVAHQATYSTGAAMLSPLKSAFDLVWPDTIATYLTNWDKDQVFKQGFVVSGGQSERGRVFIPIEYIYPRPGKRPGKPGAEPPPSDVHAHAVWQNAEDAYEDWPSEVEGWKIASKGKYDPEVVKQKIGSVVILGQRAQITGRVVSSSQ